MNVNCQPDRIQNHFEDELWRNFGSMWRKDLYTAGMTPFSGILDWVSGKGNYPEVFIHSSLLSDFECNVSSLISVLVSQTHHDGSYQNLEAKINFISLKIFVVVVVFFPGHFAPVIAKQLRPSLSEEATKIED